MELKQKTLPLKSLHTNTFSTRLSKLLLIAVSLQSPKLKYLALNLQSRGQFRMRDVNIISMP